VTCGVDGRSSQIYGHANGSISRWNGTTATLVATRERTIEGITCTPTGLLLGLENGLVEALDEDGGEIWSRQFDGTIISSEVGMEISSTPCAWLQYRSADGGGTVVCSASDGEGIAEFKFSCSPTAFTHSDEFAVVATENGSIFVIEAELFQRRLSTAAGVEESGDESDGQGGDSGEMNEEIDKRREMRAKLRRLRGE
jgi:hypothetical protein